MNAHLLDHVQEALERVEHFEIPIERFPEALTTEVRLLVGVDQEDRDSSLEVLLHGSLKL